MEQPDLSPDFPALLIAVGWVEAHCVIPDGFEKGQPLPLVDWQARCLLNFYRVKPTAKRGQLAPAFHNRRGQVVLPQKAGKAPYTAAHVCVEGVGPALFAGWAEGGETWDCRDHGCGCGWVYEYQPGEALAMAWPTPLIQITAYSEKQTDNIYRMLRPMIDEGPLCEVIPRTGEEFIRLPNSGRIDVVTSDARSRLGAPVTFVPQDETGIWTKANGMIKVAETQRRGLAGMGGRAEETTNAWDPTEGSVAQRTAESKRPDIFQHFPQAPKGLSYTNKVERRRIHRHVYAGSHWVDPDAIEGEAAELLERDPGQAERFFGNRVVAGEGAAFDPERWAELAEPAKVVESRALTVIGVDGARFRDALAVVATEVETGHQWPVGIWERPENAAADYEHPFDEVDAAMSQAFADFDVWRVYVDPQHIEHLLERWQGRWGEKRVLPWWTNRNRPIAWAVRRYEEAVGAGDLSHDGDPRFAEHIANAKKQKVNVYDEEHRQMHTISKERPDSPLRMDGAMGGVLSWEARGDAIAAGAKPKSREAIFI